MKCRVSFEIEGEILGEDQEFDSIAQLRDAIRFHFDIGYGKPLDPATDTKITNLQVREIE